MNKYSLGILAYGSLIDEPGDELEPLIIDRIKCKTPFKVEYARKSRTRGYAPTLIEYKKLGKKVNAIILVLDSKVNLKTVESMLWRRETRKTGTYIHSNNPSRNKMQIAQIHSFQNVETVLYTKLPSNIDEALNPDLLSDLAISSILTEAGDKKKDGIRYLLANKKNGIITEFSEEYERLILDKTDSESLEQAIIKMDAKRLK